MPRTGPSGALRTWPNRLVARAKRARSPSPRVRAALLTVAVVAVVVGLVASVRALDVRAEDLQWWPLVVATLVVSPATLLLNAAELRAAAAIVTPERTSLGWGLAMRTVVGATAANLLPLPAGALLRIEAVRRTGATLAGATSANLVAAGLWVAAGIGIASAAALPVRPQAGIIGLGMTALVLAVSIALAARTATTSWGRPTLLLGGIEVTTAVLHAARLWLVLVAIGVEAGLRQTLVLGAAAPLAAAAGVFPSGFGLAEGLTALLAPLAALPTAAGFLATALGRVVGLAATALAATFLGASSVRDAVRDARARAATDAPDATTPVSAPDASDG